MKCLERKQDESLYSSKTIKRLRYGKGNSKSLTETTEGMTKEGNNITSRMSFAEGIKVDRYFRSFLLKTDSKALNKQEIETLGP